MNEEIISKDKASKQMFLQYALATALLAAIGGLVYVASLRNTINTLLHSNQALTGRLEVSYNLILSKTANSEESIETTLEASRVEYFPNYVLVTGPGEKTYLWPTDRLKKFEVTRTKPRATGQR